MIGLEDKEKDLSYYSHSRNLSNENAFGNCCKNCKNKEFVVILFLGVVRTTSTMQ